MYENFLKIFWNIYMGGLLKSVNFFVRCTVESAFCIVLTTLNKRAYSQCEMYAQLPGVKPTDVLDWCLLREHTHTHTPSLIPAHVTTNFLLLQVSELCWLTFHTFLCVYHLGFQAYGWSHPYTRRLLGKGTVTGEFNIFWKWFLGYRFYCVAWMNVRGDT